MLSTAGNTQTHADKHTYLELKMINVDVVNFTLRTLEVLQEMKTAEY